MACFRPIQAYQGPGGEITFGREPKDSRSLQLPCGRCVGCRQVRVRSWAIRCLCEAQMHPASSFVTLTYSGDIGPSLVYRDFQDFMRRLRRRLGPTRFFMCGEYGELNARPHFHALLFGRMFDRWYQVKEGVYASKVLSELWPHGYSSHGEVNYGSAAYVAGYALKRAVGTAGGSAYDRMDVRTGEIVHVVPEFGHMSLGRYSDPNPLMHGGIGYSWFLKYWREVYLARDGVCLPGGRVVPSPRYFDTLLDRSDPDLLEAIKYQRVVRSAEFAADNTRRRLEVREQCALASERRKAREL